MNNQSGISIQLTLEDTEGNVFVQDVYCETADNAGFYLKGVYGERKSNPSVLQHVVYSHVDEGCNLGYLNIATFRYFWEEEINTALEQIKDCDSIIIDLRENYGGVPAIAQRYIYPHLFAENVTMENDWYMIDSKNNRKIIWEDFRSLLFRFDFEKAEEGIVSENGQELLVANRQYTYVGNLKEKKDVYVLVDSETGSAADGFAAALKETSAVLIGENTAGEGLADSYICNSLPNSGLVFIYMFGKANNSDGTDNSLFGTAPDVYAYVSAEGFEKCKQLQEDNLDPYTYENRLLWDDVLLKAVEYARESK